MRAAARLCDGDPTCLDESVVLDFVRKRFGGDVGLLAKDQWMSNSLKKRNGRQLLYYSQMHVAASGNVWVDHT